MQTWLSVCLTAKGFSAMAYDSGVSASRPLEKTALPQPLTMVLEQLWQPAIQTGEVRVMLGKPLKNDGWYDAERYQVLPSAGRASLLIPAGPRAATTGSLLNYRGLRRNRTNAQRVVLGGLARSGAPLPFPRLTIRVSASDRGDGPRLPLAVVAHDLGVSEVFASIGVRTGADRKTTLQVVSGDGAPAGFAKFAWNSRSSLAVRHEAAALRATTQQSQARTPTLLAHGEYYGWPYIVTAPLPVRCKGLRGTVPAPTPAEIFSLLPIVRSDRIADTTQFRQVRERLVALCDVGGEHRRAASAAGSLLELMNQEDVEIPVTVRWHGDFTPWNLARDHEGTLWCWDWELSQEDAVAGLDSIHWHATVAIEAGEWLDGTTLTRALRAAESTLVAAGVPRSQWAMVAGVYAATMVERACTLALGAGGWDLDWVTPAHLMDVLATAHRLVRTAIAS